MLVEVEAQLKLGQLELVVLVAVVLVLRVMRPVLVGLPILAVVLVQGTNPNLPAQAVQES